MSETTTREDIRRRRFELERWHREERERLLAEHRVEWGKRRRALQAECEAAGGHEWYDLPDNGINHLSLAGNWPQACRWCTAHKS